MFMRTHGGEDAAEQASQLLAWAMAYKASDAVEVMVKSGITAALDDGPRSVAELTTTLSLAAEPLQVLLDFGVRIGLLEITSQDFALSPVARTMLPLIDLELYTRDWHARNDSLAKVLATGTPQDPMADASDKTRAIYDKALSGFARGLALSIRRIRGLPQDAKLLDLGGGDGALATELVRVGVAREACVVDRPYVAPHFERRRATNEHPERFAFVGADLDDPSALNVHLAKADIIVVSNVVHMLSQHQRIRLWKTLHDVCRHQTTCLIYDQFPTDLGTSQVGNLSASELMIIDWLRCGVIFDLSAQEQVQEMATVGLRLDTIVNPAIVKGKIIVAYTS